MPKLLLVCWNAADAELRLEQLTRDGSAVEWRSEGREAVLAARVLQPDAVVIDLSRLPSHGREVAVTLRRQAATRALPLVIAGGAAEKVATLRSLLPDAGFTDWETVGMTLQQALSQAPTAPVVPATNPAGYSGTPLPKKLGVRAGEVVALLGAPADFATTIGELPEGAKLQDGLLPAGHLTLWFVRSRGELESGIGGMAAACGTGGLWIAWPKKSSGIVTDLSENHVRAAGLANGWVDHKICAIDATWSGLRFARAGRGK